MVLLLILIIYGFYSFGVVFAVCEWGQSVTNAFEEITDEIETFDWYLFPLELQRMLPMILMVAQQSVEFECFGSISIRREYFRKVIFNGCE